MLPPRRHAASCLFVVLGLTLLVPQARASASAEPQSGGPQSGRAFRAPQGHATAWITPGPEPELWLERQGRSELALSGEDEQFVALDWAPDGGSVAVLAVPTGTETTPFGRWWSVSLDAAVLPRQLAAAPAWAETVVDPLPAQPAGRLGPLAASLTPPTTIRVMHGAANTCRSVAVGTIDTIDFEEYVARVLPAEMPSRWPDAALQAQAIAIRTYAWYQILLGRADYDVTDTTSFQYMCDSRYANTDKATAATAGRYIAYDGKVILAQYSAENSHPTLYGGTAYLQAIMDPVGLGQTRKGHGHGLSQWGAERWALYHGWNAVQILTHYYTGVQIVDPATRDPDPLLSLTAPWPGTWITGARTYLAAHGSPALLSSVTFQAPGLSATDTITADGWSVEWPAAAPLAGPITVTVLAVTRTQAITLAGADRTPPTAALGSFSNTSVPTLTLPLSASDTGSGLGMVAAGGDWLIAATGFSKQQGTGSLIADGAALSSQALRLPAGTASRWQSQLAASLATGTIYQAYVRLRTTATTGPIARVELYDPADNTLLGFANLRGGDWRQSGSYQEFPIDFWLSSSDSGQLAAAISTTVSSPEVVLDRVRVLEAPKAYQASVDWVRDPGKGSQTRVLKVLDRAGNPSADLVATTYLDIVAPVTALAAPSLAREGQTFSVGWTITEENGVAQFKMQTSADGQAWQDVSLTASETAARSKTFTLSAQPLYVRARAVDVANNTGAWALSTIRVATKFVYLPMARR